MRAVAELGGPGAAATTRAAALAIAQERAPGRISAQFFAALRARLDAAGRPGDR
jgi:hypothetical protein